MKNPIYLILSGILVSFQMTFAQKTYYVDASGGNDSNNGQAPATAWQSINKVNSASLVAGDFVLFKRGEAFRGNLVAAYGSSSGRITYGAYGTGNKPLLLGSYQRTSLSDWTNEGGNIWRTSQVADDIGIMIFNNEASWGTKVWNAASLNAQGKFWYDGSNKVLKIYSASNPASYYTNIELARTRHIINASARSYLTFENLDLRYGSAHGIVGASTDHIWIRDVDISFIGGGQFSGTIRYGNGVEFWSAAHDNIVERCRFSHVYDVAMTAQGDEPGGYQVYNLYFRNNIVYNCEQSFEFWSRNSTTVAHDIYFENNTCLNAGSGWSHVQRVAMDNTPVASHLLFYNNDAQTSKVYIRNNVFSNSVDQGIFWWRSSDVNDVIINNNCWYETSGPIARIFEGSITYTWSAYKSATGQDAQSIFADPLLNSNYTLAGNSPCIDAGISLTTVTNDYNNVQRPQGNGYDMGAFEYYSVPAVSITASPSSTICRGNSATLTASGGNTYTWSTGQTTASIMVNPTSTTTYTVTGTSGSSSSTAIITVTVNAIPSPTITASPSFTICNGSNVTLTGSGGTTYSWNTGGTTTSITVSPSATTAYVLTAITNGCSGTTTKTVTVNAVPVTPTITQNGTVLTSSSTTGNQWYLNGGQITGATTQTYSVTQSGNYTVIVTVNGCASGPSSSISVTLTNTGHGNGKGKGHQSHTLIYSDVINSKLTLNIASETIIVIAIMKIFDVSGREVKTVSITNNESTIECSELHKGIYFYTVINNNENIAEGKFIIQ